MTPPAAGLELQESSASASTAGSGRESGHLPVIWSGEGESPPGSCRPARSRRSSRDHDVAAVEIAGGKLVRAEYETSRGLIPLVLTARFVSAIAAAPSALASSSSLSAATVIFPISALSPFHHRGGPSNRPPPALRP